MTTSQAFQGDPVGVGCNCCTTGYSGSSRRLDNGWLQGCQLLHTVELPRRDSQRLNHRDVAFERAQSDNEITTNHTYVTPYHVNDLQNTQQTMFVTHVESRGLFP